MADSIPATFDLAWKLHQAGNFGEAERLYRDILQIDPSHADSWCFLGGACQSQGKLAEAEQHYRRAAQIMPNHPSAGDCLGVLVAQQGRLDEAGDIFQQVIRYLPGSAQTYNNLGYLRYQQQRLAEAVSLFHQGLRLSPDSAETHNNLGLALADQGHMDQAINHAGLAIKYSPNFALAHNNLGHFLLKQGRPDQALPHFRQALRNQPGLITAQSNLLFCLNYDPVADPDAVFAEHARWGQHQEAAIARQPCYNDRDPERRLRIGYVSPDFRIHPLTRYFEPVLGNHDPKEVEVFCYSEVAVPDVVTKRLQNLSHYWRSTYCVPDAQVAQQIRSDRIDILVDLAGHTAGNRLQIFAHKPVPVQATWLGYMNTTGLRVVDYRLSDGFLDPVPVNGELTRSKVRDTEELMRLSGGFCCFGPPLDAPPVTPLPSLRRGYLTFGSLHNLFKLNSHVFDLWCRLLQALPTSRLLMFRDTLVGSAVEHVRSQFVQRGISPDRVDLRQGTCAPGYLGIYSEIDVSLDAFPFTGGVTTCEALWMGVPVLSLSGVRPAGRNAAALLSNVGLTDWVVQTPEEYLALGVRIAGELDKLATVRAGLRDRMNSTICDARRFTCELEQAYRIMWRRWCGRPGKLP